MSAAYDGAAKLDTIGGLFCICDGGGRPANVDDGGARFEESEGLGGLVTRLWDDEHYAYEGICQGTAVCSIRLHSSRRTRGGGLHRRVRGLCIRGFGGRNGGYHAKKLDIVIHGEGKERTGTKFGASKAEGKGKTRLDGRATVPGQGRACLPGSL